MTLLRVVLPLAVLFGLYELWNAHAGTAKTDVIEDRPGTAAISGAPIPHPASPDPSRNAAAAEAPPTQPAAASAVARLVARLDADLLNAPEYARYRQCQAREDDARSCKGLLSDALYAAMSRSLSPFCPEEAKLLSCKDEQTRRHLRIAAESAPDASTRVTALHLLLVACPDPSERAFPLADWVYEGLSERTAAEAQLLLKAHSRVPLETDASRRAVVALAVNPDVAVEVRATALSALSHTSEDAEHLADIVQVFMAQSEPGARPMFPRSAVVRALGGCGMHCLSILRQMTAASRESSEVAFEALRFFTEGEARTRLAAELAELRANASADI